ncbi:uncharacterized protein BO97DRAFT_427215 [Aspergillus homomorphus CBS 101889]|uniref:Uncharacterized protein n=1 Tax=Aspergillus homomorphus (strain CBS 101889) TaxID=1450537 RepID=A0A395HQ10_ASPHC|nr:hypothetical protein BO97DRAFT_427215 [Aspergillus homomorphus CBS 101889]RAL09579.1 hypothetical protein BO97DRAFT_427215 [Aspergillus homomorphus CBS 101889]
MDAVGTGLPAAFWESLIRGSDHDFSWDMDWQPLSARPQGHPDDPGSRPHRASMGEMPEAKIGPVQSAQLRSLDDGQVNRIPAPDFRTQSLPSALQSELSFPTSARARPSSENLGSSSRDKPATIPHFWMQQFSELNMRLYQLAATSSTPERDNNRPRQPASFPTQYAGRVIDVSSAFLALLKAIGSHTHGIDDTDVNNLSWDRGERRRDQHMSFPEYSSESSEDEFGERGGRSLEKDGRRSWRDAKKLRKTTPPLTDITTLLQLLACYLRLRRLHNILYIYIEQYMATTAATAAFRPTSSQETFNALGGGMGTGIQPPLFKDLHIGGAPLGDYHLFQVKFVLQIVVHILGEIEFSLGLPAVYRISKRPDDEGSGILGSSISPQGAQYRDAGPSSLRWARWQRDQHGVSHAQAAGPDTEASARLH